MPFAAAHSAHPRTSHAIGEVTGQVLEALGGEPPDLALLVATGHHLTDLADAGAAVRRLLGPSTLLGATAATALANGREVDEAPGIALWAGRFGAVQPWRLGAGLDRGGDPPFEPSALLLLGDPFSSVATATIASMARRWPGLPIVGGMASAAAGPGGNRLLLDDRLATSGAVGAFLGPGLAVDTIVSQGCRPVGPPFTVTAAEGTIVRQLGGRPATDRLRDLVTDGLDEGQLATFHRGGLLVGRVLEQGEVLACDLVATNGAEGSISLADEVEVGEVLQFQLRDADAAEDDLRALLTGRSVDAASRPDTALVFTDVARGRSLFEVPDLDASLVEEYLGRVPTAGMSCAGEFGPVGGRNFVHASTASIALLRERRTAG